MPEESIDISQPEDPLVVGSVLFGSSQDYVIESKEGDDDDGGKECVRSLYYAKTRSSVRDAESKDVQVMYVKVDGMACPNEPDVCDVVAVNVEPSERLGCELVGDAGRAVGAQVRSIVDGCAIARCGEVAAGMWLYSVNGERTDRMRCSDVLELVRVKSSGEMQLEFCINAGAKNTLREIRVMRALAGHPNVEEIRDAFHEGSRHFIVSERITGGTLLDLILSRDEYNGECYRIFTSPTS